MKKYYFKNFKKFKKNIFSINIIKFKMQFGTFSLIQDQLKVIKCLIVVILIIPTIILIFILLYFLLYFPF